MHRSRFLLPLFLVWCLLIAASFLHFASLEKAGSGFTRGLNRVEVLLRWHGAAFVVALVNWRLARGHALSRSRKILVRLPLWMQLVPAAAVVLFYAVAVIRA